MKQRSPEKHRFWQAAAIVAMGSLALGACTAAGSTEASQSDAGQSADTPQSSCEFPIKPDINPGHHIDRTFEEDFARLVAERNEILQVEDLQNFVINQATTNETFLFQGALRYGILTEEEVKNKRERYVNNGCLTADGEDILKRYVAKIEKANIEQGTLPEGMYTLAQDEDGKIYVANSIDVYAGMPALKITDPVTGEVYWITIKCANDNYFYQQLKNIPRGDLPQPPKPVTPPTPEQPQQPGPQPKGNAGVESPEGTWGKVDWNPSGYGHIGPETAVPAGPQVQNEGSSEWTYTPPASPQVTPGAPSNTAVAPGATTTAETPKPDPATTVGEGGGTETNLSETANNDTDVPPQD